MTEPSQLKRRIAFYRDELTDREFYLRLSRMIRDEWLSDNLRRLSSIEEKHAGFWEENLKKAGVETDKFGPRRLKVSVMLLLSKILGVGLTVKILEHGEIETVAEYRKFADESKEDPEFRSRLDGIITDEVEHENVFDSTIERTREDIETNRELIYGISDGLVEVLASLAGLAAIITDHFLISLGGIVVGVSGAMSMSLGAYLSRNSETQFKLAEIRKRIILHRERQRDDELQRIKSQSSKSAINTGIFYILGAIIPILPFLVLQRFEALILAVILVGISQGLANAIVAVSLGIPILRESIKASLLALLVAFASYMVGQAFHVIFHISVL
ncbi:MAG TPA: VIT1/CCC1 family protein [Thermoplasmataceae archaeon]|nr:VIT1/CCC1 family protein [Thermoplasmataceae archaeon]